MNSPSQLGPSTLTRGQPSSTGFHANQKLPMVLNRPPSDVNECIRKTLGVSFTPLGQPGGDESDSWELGIALERYYSVLSALQGETLIHLKKRFDRDLRYLCGQYDRSSQEMDQSYREVCVFIRKTLETFEEDVKYLARGGLESMGIRLAGRLNGPYSVTKLVESVLDWWCNAWDQKRIEHVRTNVEVLNVRRARGSVERMRKNREIVENIKRNVARFGGERGLQWDTCLRMLGMGVSDVNMALLFVATAEQGWRIEGDEMFNELGVDLGADQNCSRCMVFPSVWGDGIHDELLPVVCIKSFKYELFGLLTGDRWFGVHRADVVFGMIVRRTYVEWGERPQRWGLIERRNVGVVRFLDTKDCVWIAGLLNGEVFEEIRVLYNNVASHAERGELPEGDAVGVSTIEFREVLKREGLLANGEAMNGITTRIVSCLYSVTKGEKEFSEGLGETIVGMMRSTSIIQCNNHCARFEECKGSWCMRVTGEGMISEELETVLTRVGALMRKRGVGCVMEDAKIPVSNDAPTHVLEGRNGLEFHELWNSKCGLRGN